MSKVFLNTRLVDTDKAAIPVTDGGFLYGAGLFETMRSHNGRVFRLHDHLDRLYSSADKLAVNVPLGKEELAEAIASVLEANKLVHARLRLTLSTGSMSANEDDPRPTLLISATRLQPYPPSYFQKGILVTLCPYRQNPSDPLAGHKTTNYFSRMLALKAAHQYQAAESLWFTTEGYLAEGCISNVFLVKDGRLLTPSLLTPVLAGVARKTVCRIATLEKIELIEKAFTIDDLLAAEEVFVTNVIMTVLPVTGIEKHTVGQGTVGPLTQRLKTLFDKEIEIQCGEYS